MSTSKLPTLDETTIPEDQLVWFGCHPTSDFVLYSCDTRRMAPPLEEMCRRAGLFGPILKDYCWRSHERRGFMFAVMVHIPNTNTSVSIYEYLTSGIPLCARGYLGPRDDDNWKPWHRIREVHAENGVYRACPGSPIQHVVVGRGFERGRSPKKKAYSRLCAKVCDYMAALFFLWRRASPLSQEMRLSDASLQGLEEIWPGAVEALMPYRDLCIALQGMRVSFSRGYDSETQHMAMLHEDAELIETFWRDYAGGRLVR